MNVQMVPSAGFSRPLARTLHPSGLRPRANRENCPLGSFRNAVPPERVQIPPKNTDVFANGALGGIRTHGTLLRRQVLYPLSYEGALAFEIIL